MSRSTSALNTTTEAIDRNYPSDLLGSWIVALTESRGVGREVGIVGVELELGQIVISQVRSISCGLRTTVRHLQWHSPRGHQVDGLGLDPDGGNASHVTSWQTPKPTLKQFIGYAKDRRRTCSWLHLPHPML